MKILHTSDWHLGKTLDGFSRQNEQGMFLEELSHILEREEIDMMLISGDIFDNPIPPFKSENMLYKYLKKYSKNGERPIIIISGNHDSPEKLEALNSLSMDYGIIFIGSINTIIPEGNYGKWSIIKSSEGFIKIDKDGETISIVTLPYINDKTILSQSEGEAKDVNLQKNYSKDIGELINKLTLSFSEDSINIVMAHLFLQNGEPSDSEREILGGSLLVNMNDLPTSPQVYALGHLHKTQNFIHEKSKMSYSGAPIKYSKSERRNKNSVNIIDMKRGMVPEIKREYLNDYKPIEIWTAYSTEEAIEICTKNKDKDCYVYFEIYCENFLERDLVSTLKKIKKDIVEIKPCLNASEMTWDETEDLNFKTMEEIFFDFYKFKKGKVPSSEIMNVFNEIIEDGGYNETN